VKGVTPAWQLYDEFRICGGAVECDSAYVRKTVGTGFLLPSSLRHGHFVISSAIQRSSFLRMINWRNSYRWAVGQPIVGPAAVSTLLSVAIVVEMARIALSLAGASAGDAAAAGVAKVAQIATRREIDVGGIVAAHLFGLAASAAADPANAPVTNANLTLAGTLATDNPRAGIAIISDGGAANVYAVGDKVGVAALNSVYLDHVILDRNGILERLTLPMARGLQTPAQASADSRGVAPERTDLANVMRAEPSFSDQDGKVHGYRVYAGSNLPAFRKAGLRAGDLVMAINGSPLAARDAAQVKEILASTQSSGATLTIVRGEETKEITVDVRQ
jgi:general secretion pathway protein C